MRLIAGGIACQIGGTMTNHDHLCDQPNASAPCIRCAEIANIREDERYRVAEQVMALPETSSVEVVVNAILPLDGDPLRRREPRADLGFGR